jgi:4-aminobutyrate aminotransferase-like enzyme/Ser/Thr protein kinase RdoA (MazF antagonist)
MNFSIGTIENWVANYYGIEVKASVLNGYDELNFLLTEKSGKKNILKVSNSSHDYFFLEAQVKILQHLSKSDLAAEFQVYTLNKKGETLTEIIVEETTYYIRILSFLEGSFWVEAPEKNKTLFENLGSFLGKMDKNLKGFKHPGMHRHYTWDISTARDANYKMNYIQDAAKKRIADYFMLQFETEVLPTLSSYRQAYTHNDANDYNVLVKGDKIAGLIDFGDMVYTALINNVAVACTYAMLHQSDPLSAAVLVVKGYHSAYAIDEKELSILYYLIAARLCISVTQSAYNGSLDTKNEHHFITEKPAWDLLCYLITLNPIKAENDFRLACNYTSLIQVNETYKNLEVKRNAHIGRNLSISYEKHLKIDKAALQYLYDDKGNTYIDCVNNVSHIGHCHPRVVRVMQKQIASLNTNTRYLNNHLIQYAQKLTASLPAGLNVCYFTNSGSEANDLAIRISRHFTKQKDIIVLDHAYHGTSTATIEMSPYKFDREGGIGQMPWIHKAINPDLYRGPYQYEDANAGVKYAKDVKNIIDTIAKENKKPAAFICETLLGVGGQMPLPPHYLKEVYQHVRAAGGICIADEVQVGFGRVGTHFWGFELQAVVPDIVVLGKPIGNGHPLAAVIVTDAIANSFNNGIEYFNTYGGNPVSMATGMAVLEVIQGEGLQENALQVGNYLLEGMRQLMNSYPIIGDVRGAGLFIGVEFVKDRNTKEPAIDSIKLVVERMKEKGFLMGVDGPYNNVLKIKPPIIFSMENAKDMLTNLDLVLASLL